MQAGDAPVKPRPRARPCALLGSVGEPINPEAWDWYYQRRRRRPLPDRRHLVADRDRRHPDHAAAGRHQSSSPARRRGRSSASGRELVDADGKVLEGACEGNLVHRRFLARPDAHGLRRPRALRRRPTSRPIRASTSPATAAAATQDGYYWITGRVDDVINVSGHRMGTAEVESALVAHPKVSEAAVVGYPHDIKGQGIYAYVTLMAGEEPIGGPAQGARRLGPQGDRPDRLART